MAATVATVSRAGGGAAALAGALPWTTIRGQQPLDAREMAEAAAPALLAALPRPNLRWPAVSILVTLASDVAIVLLRGGPIAWPMLALRLVTGLATSLLGLAAGAGGGLVRKLTGIASVAFGVAQLVSLLAGAWALIATPAQLLPLLLSLVAIISGLVLSVSTAVGAWRR